MTLSFDEVTLPLNTNGPASRAKVGTAKPREKTRAAVPAIKLLIIAPRPGPQVSYPYGESAHEPSQAQESHDNL